MHTVNAMLHLPYGIAGFPQFSVSEIISQFSEKLYHFQLKRVTSMGQSKFQNPSCDLYGEMEGKLKNKKIIDQGKIRAFLNVYHLFWLNPLKIRSRLLRSDIVETL